MLHVDTGPVSTQMMKHQLSFIYIYIMSLVDRYGEWRYQRLDLTVYNIHIVVAVSCGCMVCVALCWLGLGLESETRSFYPLLSWPLYKPPPATTSCRKTSTFRTGNYPDQPGQEHTCVKMSALETGDCSLATNTGRKWPGAAAPWSHGDHLFALGVNRINNISVR